MTNRRVPIFIVDTLNIDTLVKGKHSWPAVKAKTAIRLIQEIVIYQWLGIVVYTDRVEIWLQILHFLTILQFP